MREGRSATATVTVTETETPALAKESRSPPPLPRAHHRQEHHRQERRRRIHRRRARRRRARRRRRPRARGEDEVGRRPDPPQPPPRRGLSATAPGSREATSAGRSPRQARPQRGRESDPRSPGLATTSRTCRQQPPAPSPPPGPARGATARRQVTQQKTRPRATMTRRRRGARRAPRGRARRTRRTRRARCTGLAPRSTAGAPEPGTPKNLLQAWLWADGCARRRAEQLATARGMRPETEPRKARPSDRIDGGGCDGRWGEARRSR